MTERGATEGEAAIGLLRRIETLEGQYAEEHFRANRAVRRVAELEERCAQYVERIRLLEETVEDTGKLLMSVWGKS